MYREYNKTKVDVTEEDKISLVEHIDAINEILNKYPYSMDPKSNFLTTMTRAKNTCHELAALINALDVKKQEGEVE